MKKTVTAIVALAAVSAASFWFGQQRGMQDFSRCVEAGGLPVGADYGEAPAADSNLSASSVVGEWRFASSESLTRSFLPDGRYRDAHDGEPFDEFGEWKISGNSVLLSSDGETSRYVISDEADGTSSLTSVGEGGEEKFIR